MIKYKSQVLDILEGSKVQLSNLLPSEWAEMNRVMTTDVSPFPGKFSYSRTPYFKEVVDCLSPYHDAHTVAIMKGSQIGCSTTVIESGIGYIIANTPGNILFLVGHTDLVEEAMNKKIDQMIDSCGLRSLIRPNVQRRKNSRTGDTSTSKEFPGGSLIAGSASNHKLLRQRSVQFGFIDDFDAAKKASKESGSTVSMIEQRFAAYSSKMKLFYISTPERKESSNIEPAFLLGDQRRYCIPCPKCGDLIPLMWTVTIEGTDGKEKGGMHWKEDNHGLLIPGSVEYICQSCGSAFDDTDKDELNLAGRWKPTAIPSVDGYYSYHISSLYAPSGMYDWDYYVRKYLKACPPGQDRKEDLYKAFINTVLGETYEQQGESPKANDLQKNCRAYEIGIVPEKLSIRDGNGKIILLTCAADMNGTENDARLDWEIVAWSESGANYSIKHGSIGTFIPREGAMKVKGDRAHWTYERGKQNSVWPEFQKIITAHIPTDTARKMPVFITGLDCGHYSNYAYSFIDKANGAYVVGLKGKDIERYTRFNADVAQFKPAKERPNLFLVEVNAVKDDLSEYMKLKWDEKEDSVQPFGFMNYPNPANDLYAFKNFFSHYESEHRVLETRPDGSVITRWVKKSSTSQNHFWDVRGYNIILRDILVSLTFKELKVKNYTWGDFVSMVLSK